MALRRFLALYGKPASINSDNGNNFVGAEKELVKDVKKLNEERDLQKWVAKEGISWKFQSPSAPHFGGPRKSRKTNKINLIQSSRC